LCCKIGVSAKAVRKRARKEASMTKPTFAVVPECLIRSNTSSSLIESTVPVPTLQTTNETPPFKKKATFVQLVDSMSDDDHPSPHLQPWKQSRIETKQRDRVKMSNVFIQSRINPKPIIKSCSVDSGCSSSIVNSELAQLDYLHATAYPPPLPSERVRVPSFHSQDLNMDDEEDMESILKQFL
jgi:hypothetical protein